MTLLYIEELYKEFRYPSAEEMKRILELYKLPTSQRRLCLISTPLGPASHIWEAYMADRSILDAAEDDRSLNRCWDPEATDDGTEEDSDEPES